MSRRDAIRMSPGEIRDFVAEQRTIQVATLGPSGRPHLAPLWFYPDGTDLHTWTYARSQKAVNLGRDPRATVLLETGASYEALRGVMLECDVDLVTDERAVGDLGLRLMSRYADPVPDATDTAGLESMVRAQAAKRVGLILRPTRTVSWDHRKLGGTY